MRKFRINCILILFLAVLSSIFFVWQFNKEHVLNNTYAKTISSLTREIKDLQRSVSLYESKEIYLRSIVKSKEKKLDRIAKANVTLTGYHPWSNGINSDGHPQTTATMTIPVVGRTCAISSELVKRGWLGKKIYIEGIGVFKAEDRMNSSIDGLRIDLCMGSLKEALTFGKKENVLAINLN
ncbi:3D domain-containing protein [Desulfobacula sp.]